MMALEIPIALSMQEPQRVQRRLQIPAIFKSFMKINLMFTYHLHPAPGSLRLDQLSKEIEHISLDRSQ